MCINRDNRTTKIVNTMANSKSYKLYKEKNMNSLLEKEKLPENIQRIKKYLLIAIATG